MYYVLLVINSLLISSGQILLKKSALNFAGSPIFNKLLNPYFIIGLLFYGVSTLLWIKILEKIEVSVAYPFMGISYIIVVIGSHFIFNEAITVSKIFGMIFITLGMIFISK